MYPNLNGLVIACRHPANHGNPIVLKESENGVVGYVFTCAGSPRPDPVVFQVATGDQGQPVLTAVYSPNHPNTDIWVNLQALWVNALCYDRACPDLPVELRIAPRKFTYKVGVSPVDLSIYELPLYRPDTQKDGIIKMGFDIDDLSMACRHPANNGVPSFTKENFFKDGVNYYVFRCAGSSHPHPVLFLTVEQVNSPQPEKHLYFYGVMNPDMLPTKENFFNYVEEIRGRAICYDKSCQ
jgi:hypothetical protein